MPTYIKNSNSNTSLNQLCSLPKLFVIKFNTIVTPTKHIVDFKPWTGTHGKGIPSYFGNRS